MSTDKLLTQLRNMLVHHNCDVPFTFEGSSFAFVSMSCCGFDVICRLIRTMHTQHLGNGIKSRTKSVPMIDSLITLELCRRESLAG